MYLIIYSVTASVLGKFSHLQGQATLLHLCSSFSGPGSGTQFFVFNLLFEFSGNFVSLGFGLTFLWAFVSAELRMYAILSLLSRAIDNFVCRSFSKTLQFCRYWFGMYSFSQDTLLGYCTRCVTSRRDISILSLFYLFSNLLLPMHENIIFGVLHLGL